ncbi:MAG: hypothetical protein IT364_18335 [Candidatus Hydrogenedentes bacterium]|nr:hypothetical protein [Candidatus Hydrogenedentota bacterium]
MIPRLRTTVAGFLFMISVAGYPSVCVAEPEPAGASLRLWVETTGGSSTTNASLKTTSAEEYALPATVLWTGELDSKESYDQVTAKLTVYSASGEALHEGAVEIQVTEGVNPFALTWTPEGLGEGDYRGELTVKRQSGDLLATETFRIRLISREELDTQLAETAQKLQEIRDHLAHVLAGTAVPPYSAMRLAVVEEYLPVAREAADSGDWRRAESDLNFLAGLLVAVRSELSFAGDPERMKDSAVPAVDSPQIENGGFVSGGRPVFLLGAADEAGALALELPALRRYGLNLAVTKQSPAQTRATRDAVPAISGELARLLDEAEAQHVGVTVRLAPESLAPWVAERYPAIAKRQTGSFPYDVRNPQAGSLLEEHFRCVLGRLQGRTSIVSVALADRPELQFTGEDVRQGLIAFAKATYGDHESVNRAWETLYLDLDEIQVRWDFMRLAYRHDLEVYQHGLGTAFLTKLAETARAAAPGLPLQIDYTDRVFDTGESALGIDREMLSVLTDINGCIAAQDTDHPYLALGYPSQSLYYTLMRSFSPGEPVFNAGDGFTADPRSTLESLRRAAHTLAWEGAMAGLSASAVPLGTRDGSRSTLLGTPERLEGYAAACLDLNRLAPIVRAFQESPAGISILWSMSAKIYSNGEPYLQSVRRAYEGCHTFGYPVNFVTEAGCARGALDSVKILVIPDTPSLADEAYQAIDEYIGNGGVVVRMGKPISYTPRGTSRQGALATSTRAVLIRGTDLPTDYLHALDAACALEGVEQVPHAVNGSGYPLEAVKTRFVKVDEVPYLYIVNLRKTAETVHMTGPYQEGRDLIEERVVRFPATLDPLDPMLVRLEKQPEEEQPAGELVASTGVPTGVVEPIQKEVPEVAKAPAPQKRHGTR